MQSIWTDIVQCMGRYKWGQTPFGEAQCNIEEPVKEKKRGKRLRQQPFETARELLPPLMRYKVTEEDLVAKVQRAF